MLDKNNPYHQQVALLLEVLPLVGRESCFALKGGTAINLFVRNMPRLSVDIDLAYLPVQDRAASLLEVAAALERIAASHGLELLRDIEMPSNNRILVWEAKGSNN